MSPLPIIGTSRPPNASDLRARGLTGLPDPDHAVVLLRAKLELRQARLKGRVRAYHTERMARKGLGTGRNNNNNFSSKKELSTGSKGGGDADIGNSGSGDARVAIAGSGDVKDTVEEKDAACVDAVRRHCGDDVSFVGRESEERGARLGGRRVGGGGALEERGAEGLVGNGRAEGLVGSGKVERVLRGRKEMQLRPFGLEREGYRRMVGGGGVEARGDGE